MYNIYMDQMSDELTDDENYDETEKLRVEVFPYKITSKNIEYWCCAHLLGI